MTHLPFRDWIFNDYPEFTGAQMSELKQHLLECPECRALSGARHRMESAMMQKEMAAPAAGFTQRWQARLAVDRQRLHRRQTRVVMLLTISALITLLSALVIFLWPWLSAIEAVFWAAVYQLFSVYLFLASVGEFMTGLMLAMTRALPLVGWVLAIGMIFELGVLWVVSYRFLTNPRRLDIP